MNRRVALVVGVDTYEDPQLTTLRCAVQDATELAAFLKYRAAYDRVEQLVSGVTDDQVVDTAVRLAAELEPGDLFVFYFSGHGIEYSGRHLLLCPKAQYGRLQFYRQTVPVDQLRDETARPGVDRVFILDACRTSPVAGRGVGGLRGEVILRDVVANAQAKASDAGSFGMMSSCSEGEQAGELVSRQNGLFTAALLSVLATRIAAGNETRLDDDLRVSVAKEMAALGTQEGVWHTQNPWTQCSGPGTPVLIPSGVQEVSQGPAASPQARPQRVRPIARGEGSRAGLTAQQELRCGNCGKRIVSELGIVGRCQVCQAALCAECFEIREINRCARHQEQAK
ncbi:MAG: caspase family protein [Sedimentisphaerales bacterium]|nr:caspase family protein [Sedimentisphaerales bacterium]